MENLPGLIGQERAIEAVTFGIGLKHHGYNLFALGVSGTGKHTVIADYLRREAARQQTPDDWSYVNNFDDPARPKALRLPAGPLRDAMRKLVEEIRAVLPRTFESEDYRARRDMINERFKQQSEQAFGELQERAKARASPEGGDDDRNSRNEKRARAGSGNAGVKLFSAPIPHGRKRTSAALITFAIQSDRNLNTKDRR